MRTVMALSLLLAILHGAQSIPGTAHAASVSAGTPDIVDDVLLLKASGSGKLFLGGNLIEGPWTLAYDHGRFTVNGFTLRPPPPSPPPTPEQRAEGEFLSAAGELADSLSRSDLSVTTRRQRFVEFLERNNVGYRIGIDTTFVEIHSARGIQILFGLVVHPLYSGNAPSMTLRDSQLVHLNELKSVLAQGHVVFIVDRATTIVGQQTGDIMVAIARLKHGAKLDSLDLHLLDRSVRDQLVNPLPLDDIW
jgi:hypothetical protein